MYQSDQAIPYQLTGPANEVFSVDVRIDGGPSLVFARFIFTMPATGTYTGNWAINTFPDDGDYTIKVRPGAGNGTGNWAGASDDSRGFLIMNPPEY